MNRKRYVAAAALLCAFLYLAPVVVNAFPGGEAGSVVLGQSIFTTATSGDSATGMSGPSVMAFDSSGDLWVADYHNNRVLEFAAPLTDGEAATLVLGQTGFTTSTASDSATTMSGPSQVAFDSSGDLWVADRTNNRVLEFAAPFTTGEAATLVLGQSAGFNNNGAGDTANEMTGPQGIAFDSSGNLWVGDQSNSRVLEFSKGSGFTSDQAATLVLGQTSLTASGSGDSATGMSGPSVIVFDSSGNLWVADQSNSRVIEFAAPFATDKAATLVLGQSNGFNNNSPGDTAVDLDVPSGVTLDSSGNLWVADQGNNRVLEFLKGSGFISEEAATLVLGQQQTGFTTSVATDGATGLSGPSVATFDSSGDLWVADQSNSRIVEYPKGSGLTTGEAASLVLGQTGFGTDATGDTATTLSFPGAVAFDSSGDLWVADRSNSRVLEYRAPFSTGEAATLVLGQTGFTSSGTGDSATALDGPQGLTFDSSGDLWVADSSNERVLEYRAPFSTGEAATLEVGQPNGFGNTNPGDSATAMDYPTQVTFDSSGNLWVTDQSNSRILEFLKSTGFTTGEAASLVLGQTGFTTASTGDTATTMDRPFGLAFDSSGNLWVADQGNNRVLEFVNGGSGFTSDQAATRVVGQTSFTTAVAGTATTAIDGPQGVTFDSSGNLWVTDYTNNRVIEFLAPVTTGAVVACSPSSTVDASTSTTCTAAVTGQSGSITGETVTWSQTGGAGSVSFSAGTCSLSGLPETCSVTVTGVTAGSATVQASYPGDANNLASSNTVAVTVNSAVVAAPITPSSPTIDLGQSITLTANPSAGTTPYSYQWYSGSSATCSSDSAIGGATLSTYLASPVSSTYYCYQVTDSASAPVAVKSATDLVTVNPALGAPPLSPSSPTVDAGQSLVVTVSWSGGTSTYTVKLYSGASSTCSSDTTLAATTPGVSGTSTTFSVSPASSTYYCATVKDSAASPSTTTSPTDLVTVNPALSAGAITPSGPSIDLGQSVTLAANPSGGTTPYAYQWYTGAGCTSPISGATGSTYSASPSLTTTYYVKVIDGSSAGAQSACSSGDPITVNAALSAGQITPSSPVIDVGTTVILTANPSGGTNPYFYQWYASSDCSTTPVSGAMSSAYSASTEGTYYVLVTDSAGTPTSACSSGDLVTVNPALSAGSISPSSPSIDLGQSVTLTSNPSGGTSPYTYQWYTSSDCSTSPVSGATGSAYSASSAGTYYVLITDSASTQASACSSGDTVMVNPALSAGAITPSSPSVDLGQSITLTANPSGGTSPYTYQWYTSSDCSTVPVSGATLSAYSASSSGTYYVQVTDSSSAGAQSTCSSGDSVTVNPALSTGSGTITPSSPSIDLGQSVTLTASPSGGTTSYAYQWYTSPDCSTSPISGATSSIYPASPSLTTTYYVRVTDSSSAGAQSICSSGDEVTANPALSAGSISPSSPSTNLGQSVTLTANPSGGTAPYAYQWYTGTSCTIPVAGATSSTYSPSPSSATTYYVQVTDSASTQTSSCSSGDAVIVNPALSAGAIAPSSPSVDSGQSITLTANPSGGTPGYAYQWYTSSDCSTSPISGATSSAYSISSAGTYYVQVTDSASNPVSACSSGDTVTVNPVLTVGAITPSAPSINSSQSVTLAASPSGGTSPYTYQWHTSAGCTSPVSGATGSTYQASPSSSTTYYVQVTDGSAAGVESICSSGDTVSVSGQSGGGGGGPGPATSVVQPITLTESSSGVPLNFSVTGCGVSQLTVAGDGLPHLLTVPPSCTLTITLSGGDTATERFVFSGGASSTTMLTCLVGTCQNARLTYYHQFLQTVSYQVNGGGSGYTAPVLNGTSLGAPSPIILTTTPTSVWLDASGQINVSSLLPGSGPQTRWVMLASGTASLDASSSHTQLFQYFTQYSITVSAAPAGSATTSPTGQSWYNSSSTISLDATPNGTVSFTGWVSSGGDSIFANSSALDTTMTAEGPDVATATFLGPAILPLSVDPATAAMSPVTVSLSGCDVTPATLSGSAQVQATPGCTITLSLPAAGAGATTHYVFSDGASSMLVTTCAAGTTCGAVSLSYYQQDLVTVSVVMIGGGGPSPEVVYTTLGHSTSSSSSSPFWVDHGSQLIFSATISGTSSSERWLLTSPSSVVAAPGATITASYRHQFQIESSFSVIGGRSGYAAPVLTYFTSGTNSSIDAPAQPGTPVWADSGSHWSITNPLPTAGSLYNESSVVWGTAQPSNGTVSAPVTASPIYSPLYRVVFEEQGLPEGSSWSVDVGTRLYASTGQTLNALVPDTQYSWNLPQSGVTGANGTVYAPLVGSGNVTLPTQSAIDVRFTSIIPATVNIGSTSQVNTTTFDPAFKMASSWTDSNTLSVTVSPTGNETGMRIIQIEFPTSLLDGAPVGSVLVTLDGVQIQNATSLQQLLSPPTGAVANYAVSTTASGFEVLVSIPHFSTHTILLTFPDAIVSSSASSSTDSSASSSTDSSASSSSSSLNSSSTTTSTTSSTTSSSTSPNNSLDTSLYLLAGAAAIVFVALLFFALKRRRRTQKEPAGQPPAASAPTGPDAPSAILVMGHSGGRRRHDTRPLT